MQNYVTQYLPSYSVGEDAFEAVSEVVAETRVVLIGGHHALAAASAKLTAALERAGIKVLGEIWYGGRATYENVERIRSTSEVIDAEAIFAVGGGCAIDTCKIVARCLRKKLYTVPTIASNCSPVSCISIMYNSNGSFKEIVQLHIPPTHCFIDTAVIAASPEIYLWAGIGDTIAKYYEVTFSMRDDDPPYNPVLGRMISHMCNEPLLSCAEQAYEDACASRATPALEHAVMNIVVSTGIVSGLVGVDYNSALAHALFYGLTTIPSVERDHLHGEVVSYGVLVQLAMDEDDFELERLLRIYRRLGLPTCLADLNLSLSDDLTPALIAAEKNQELEHVPYPVTCERILHAIERLEGISAACPYPPAAAPCIFAGERK